MKGFFYVDRGCLVPTEDAKDVIRGLEDGEIVEVTYSRPRNGQLLRKYWQICQYVADACPGVETKNQVDAILKIKSGHVDLINFQGQIYQVPASIAFNKMDENEFQEFFSKCVKIIMEVFLPNMTEREIVEEIERMVGARIG
jgi:hypothetical protein